MAAEMKNVIEIQIGQEHQLVKEQNIADETLMMHSAYEAALIALKNIVSASDRWCDNAGSMSDRDCISSLYGYSNNIIAFDAHRGQGKTSAMLSFAKALHNYSDGKPFGSTDKANAWEFIHDNLDKNNDSETRHHFSAVPAIDPTMLHNRERIINLILSWLMGEITQIWNGESPYSDNRYYSRGNSHFDEQQREARKEEIFRKMMRCRKSLPSRNEKADKEIDAWEELAQKDAIFDLKKELHEIVQYYFELRGWDKNKSLLVIQIDDTDMQLSNAYEVLEDIRIYLSMPNVVVFMATYLWQLRTIVAQHFANDMKTAIEQGYTDANKVSRIAAKYMDKLIPTGNTVYLPTIKLQREINNRLYVKFVDKNGKEIPVVDDGESKEGKGRDLEQTFFKLIYQKTGVVFTRHENYMHNIFPSTLRGLMHLFMFLNSMKDPTKTYLEKVDDDDKLTLDYWAERRKSEQQRLINLKAFESYFLNDWCPSKMTTTMSQKIEKIEETAGGQRFIRAFLALGGNKNRIKKCDDNKETAYIILAERLAEYIDYYYAEVEDVFPFAVQTYFTIQFNTQMMVSVIRLCDEMIKNSSCEVNIDKVERMIRKGFFDTIFHINTENCFSFFQKDNNGCVIKTPNNVGELVEGIKRIFDVKCRNENDKDNKIVISSSKDMQYLDLLLLICCNWDIQKQICTNWKDVAIDATNLSYESVLEKIYDYLSEQHFILSEACFDKIEKVKKPEEQQS